MAWKNALKAAALTFVALAIGACDNPETKEDVTKALKNCPFEIPAAMRSARREYDQAFSASDLEGLVQSRATCENGVEAAKTYWEALADIESDISFRCPNYASAGKQLKKVHDTQQSLQRQIDETDCEAIYGKQ